MGNGRRCLPCQMTWRQRPTSRIFALVLNGKFRSYSAVHCHSEAGEKTFILYVMDKPNKLQKMFIIVVPF
jgi:hypothetical protein